MSKCRSRVTINVSGEIFETFEETFERFPTTLLGNKRRRGKYYNLVTRQYFFDRNRRCFECILYFYQSKGTLNCPKGVPIKVFEEECAFFRIPRRFINDMMKNEGVFPELLFEENNDALVESLPFRLRVWNILERPRTSSNAWRFGMISLSIVCLSIISATMETMSNFDSQLAAWSAMELAVNIWFVVELLLRVYFSGNIFGFMSNYMNIVDIVAVIPYFLLLIAKMKTVANLIKVLKTLKFLRVCRSVI